MAYSLIILDHKFKLTMKDIVACLAISLISTLNVSYYYRILLLFRGEKASRFDVLPEKLSRLPVILPILGIFDTNIHGKTFAVTKRSVKTAKLFHHETNAIHGITCAHNVSWSNEYAFNVPQGSYQPTALCCYNCYTSY